MKNDTLKKWSDTRDGVFRTFIVSFLIFVYVANKQCDGMTGFHCVINVAAGKELLL